MGIFVGVGGTGQHAALAYLHLANVARFDPVPIVIFDNDISSPTMQALQDMAQRLKAQVALVQPFPDPKDMGGALTANAAFQREVELRSIFFESDLKVGGGVEADAPMNFGFFGIPHLSAVFSRMVFKDVTATGPTNHPVYQRLIAPANRLEGNRKRVGVCGSVVGGCGAGVIPQLLVLLDKACRSSQPKASVQAALTAQTFELEGTPPPPPAGVDPVVWSRKLDRKVQDANAASVLGHVDSVLSSSADVLVYLSAADGRLLRRKDASNGNQPPTPDYFHVILAVLQHLFFNASPEEIRGPMQKCFSSGPREVEPGVLPVPDQALIRAASRGLPYQNFETPLEGIQIDGRQVMALLPEFSLLRWLWVVRIQADLAARVRSLLPSSWLYEKFIAIQHNIKDQIMGSGVHEGVGPVLSGLIDQAQSSLAFFAEAFLDGTKTRAGVASKRALGSGEDGDWWEVLDMSRDWNAWRGSAGIVFGQQLASEVKKLLTEPAGEIWQTWVKPPSPVTAEDFARELFGRCRRVAERIVDYKSL